MKPFLAGIAVAIVFLGALGRAFADSIDDQSFQTLADRYVAQYLEQHPERATSLGDHRFDDRLDDYSRGGSERELASTRDYLGLLKKIPIARLSPENRTDYGILKDSLESRILEGETIRSLEWNPMIYNAADPIYHLLAREYAPLADRLQSVMGRLQLITNITESAQRNLKNPPRLHTETAIRQNKGSIRLIEVELNEFLAQAPGMREKLVPIQNAAVRTLTDYGQWLEKVLLPRSTGDFRYGDEKFRAKLRYSLGSDLTREQILAKAEADLAKTQREIQETALPLYQAFFPAADKSAVDKRKMVRAVLDKLAEERPTDRTIVGQARRDLADATRFVTEHQIVSVPQEPLQIIVMPEFKRGVAVAYCDAPGALARKEATFFAISPTPSDWTETKKESFYREYNNYMMKNLTVHEAMPGHYLQLMHANQFKGSTKIRAIFPSGIFAEGWATYTEQVMAGLGFGGPEVRMQQLKMRLRLIINAIIDQKIHTAHMTEREAMDLMMNEGFQEEGEAAGKWKRACLTATQLSTYFIGNLEVNEMVSQYRARHPEMSLRNLHDRLLSHGSVAPKHLKALLE